MSEKIPNTRVLICIAVITELACSKSITMKVFPQSYDKMINTVAHSQVHENIVNYIISRYLAVSCQNSCSIYKYFRKETEHLRDGSGFPLPGKTAR